MQSISQCRSRFVNLRIRSGLLGHNQPVSEWSYSGTWNGHGKERKRTAAPSSRLHPNGKHLTLKALLVTQSTALDGRVCQLVGSATDHRVASFTVLAMEVDAQLSLCNTYERAAARPEVACSANFT